jgi:hypothetical protein
MSSRLCGYCRIAGHTRPKCPILHYTRRRIFNHTVGMRRDMLFALAERGISNGSIINVAEYSGEQKMIATVVNLEECVNNWIFHSCNRDKYAKTVTVTYEDFSMKCAYKRFQIKALVSRESQMGLRTFFLSPRILFPENPINNISISDPIKREDYDLSFVPQETLEYGIYAHSRLMIDQDNGYSMLRRETLFDY